MRELTPRFPYGIPRRAIGLLLTTKESYNYTVLTGHGGYFYEGREDEFDAAYDSPGSEG